MKKLLGNIKRMWISLKGIFSAATTTATRGTGVAVKTIGGAVGTGIAFLALISMLIIVAIAAIPYGAFAANKFNIEPISQSSHSACENCGQTDVPLFRHDKNIICGECLRDSKMPESPNKPELQKETNNVAKN